MSILFLKRVIAITISRTGKLTNRISFKKKDGYAQGPNGIKVPRYVEVIRPWFAYKQKFLSEVKAETTAYKDTVNIIIRQKQKEEIQPDWIGVISGTEYNIIEINPDVENEAFMLLVLKAVE